MATIKSNNLNEGVVFHHDVTLVSYMIKRSNYTNLHWRRVGKWKLCHCIAEPTEKSHILLYPSNIEGKVSSHGPGKKK